MINYEQFGIPDISSLHHAPLLQSREDFEQWYMNNYIDPDICTEDDVHELLEEVCPAVYPCIPLQSATSIELIYVTPQVIIILQDKLR